MTTRFILGICALAACGQTADLGSNSGTGGATDAGASEGAEASSPGDDGGSADGGEGTAPSIGILNLTWGNTTFASTLNFVIENQTSSAIESIETIEISLGSQPEPAVYTVDFAKAGFDSKTCTAWSLAPGQKSGVNELVLHGNDQQCQLTGASTTCTDWWSIDVPCDGTRVLDRVWPKKIMPIVMVEDDAYIDQPITLRLSGLLADGSTWSAEATGPLRK